MATATTSKVVKTTANAEPFAMMEYKGIFARLIEEVVLAAKSFSQDPRAFLKELFFDESQDLRRKKLIRTGLSLALVFHVAAGVFLVTFKWRGSPLSKKVDPQEQLVVKEWITPNKPKPEDQPTPNSPSQNNLAKTKQEGFSGGDKTAAPSGGGQSDSRPASLGAPPAVRKFPPLIAMNAPQGGPQSTLPTPVTIQGNEDTPPPPPGTAIGSPTGKESTEPSGGRSPGTGIGDGKGDGVGNNKGPGAGNENGTGTPGSGGKSGTPDGSIVPSGVLFEKIRQMPESTGIVWVRRVRPIVTPEAQDNKVYGYVLLEATFNADGTITDIIVRQHLQGMDGPAIEALRRAKFRPATIKGQPVTLYKVPIKVPVNLESSS